jgi:5-methyltetrahydropteroyltriglutamate--homocysteine methyltransferase
LIGWRGASGHAMNRKCCEETSMAPRPPFRADHVGSLLRPAYLHEARESAQKGAITREALRQSEDRAIREAVALQESVGLQSVTDGEFRRAFWHVDFLTGFDGIVATQSQYAAKFKGEDGTTAETRSMLVVDGKIRRTRPVMLEHFNFLKAATKRVAKLCIPSPTYLHMRGGRKVVSRAAYPEMEEFWTDIIAAYRAEIRDLAVAGLAYLQLDDVAISCLCDPEIRAQIARDGEDADALAPRYAAVVNAIIAERPASLGITIHTCRGNFQSMWMASGGYDAVADAILSRLAVDGFFLEYDTERAGGFEPLRFVPKGKKVVLGLVSTKIAALESKDQLKRRIEAASRYVPIENLCLSPQCGFASSHHGNRISEEIERRKLAAQEVWGSAA